MSRRVSTRPNDWRVEPFVGMAVAVYTGRGRRQEPKRATITTMNTLWIMLDNGESYSRGRGIKRGQADAYTYSYILPWDSGVDDQIHTLKEEQDRERIYQRIERINWRRVRMEIILQILDIVESRGKQPPEKQCG